MTQIAQSWALTACPTRGVAADRQANLEAADSMIGLPSVSLLYAAFSLVTAATGFQERQKRLLEVRRAAALHSNFSLRQHARAKETCISIDAQDSLDIAGWQSLSHVLCSFHLQASSNTAVQTRLDCKHTNEHMGLTWHCLCKNSCTLHSTGAVAELLGKLLRGICTWPGKRD